VQSVVQLDDIDAGDCSLANDGDGESDYGQIDEDPAAKIMQNLDCEWAVAIHEKEGDGIENEQTQQHEQEQEEQLKEQEEEQEKQ
jgi:hypothetical protein